MLNENNSWNFDSIFFDSSHLHSLMSYQNIVPTQDPVNISECGGIFIKEPNQNAKTICGQTKSQDAHKQTTFWD